MNKNLKSIILMIAAMGCLTLTDLFIKIASQTLPIGQVMIFYGVGALIVFWLMLRINGEAIQISPLASSAVLFRNVGDLIALNSMFLALVYVPLSTIGAIIQTVPIMVTAAAALFLGEQVGIRRMSAILVGFFGTLLIIQPGASNFDLTAIIALIAAVGMALRDIATKLVRENYSTLLLSFYSCFLFIFSGIILLIIGGQTIATDMDDIGILLAIVAAGSSGFFFMTEAIRLGDISVVSPFRYTRLLFSIAAGVLILGEQINIFMVVGSALTILSGLYIWRREIVVGGLK
jgi:drug/metabolite transporter (DMT)-like permease